MPPQSSLFPAMEKIKILWKTPLVGTGPSKLLKERSIAYNKLKFWKNSGMPPDKSLYQIYNCSSPLMELNVRGISPDRLFFVRFRALSPTMSPREEGIVPCNKLPSKARYSSTSQSPNVPGISPSNLFLDKQKILAFFNFPTCKGIGPVSKLGLKSMPCYRKGKSTTSLGVAPSRKSLDDDKTVRCCRRPSVAGLIVPCNAWKDASRKHSSVRLPREGGMCPERLLPRNSRNCNGEIVAFAVTDANKKEMRAASAHSGKKHLNYIF